VIGERPIGFTPIGALVAEPVTISMVASRIPTASSRAAIVGAAFATLLTDPSARREYLVTLYPVTAT